MAVSGLLAWATCPRHKISPYFVVERKTRPDNPDLHSPPILELGLSQSWAEPAASWFSSESLLCTHSGC